MSLCIGVVLLIIVRKHFFKNKKFMFFGPRNIEVYFSENIFTFMFVCFLNLDSWHIDYLI